MALVNLAYQYTELNAINSLYIEDQFIYKSHFHLNNHNITHSVIHLTSFLLIVLFICIYFCGLLFGVFSYFAVLCP